MEQLNRVELRGTVGSVYVKDFGNTKVANFSVATNYCYRSSQGEPVIETTWHRIMAWDSTDNADAFRIGKGDRVHVIGRLRVQRYTGTDGVERSLVEIVASKVEGITD